MTTTVASIGTLASQPREADVYYAIEMSTANHLMIVFRGYGINEDKLREMRDRTKRYLTRHINGFKSSLVPVRVDNNRGGVYTVVPIYQGQMTPQLRNELLGHFAANHVIEWVNTDAELVSPVTPTKDRVIRHVGKPDYTPRKIDRTGLINDYLKQPIGSLTQLCQQRNINPSWSKVSMASLLADWDIRNGSVSPVEMTAEVVEVTPQPNPSLRSKVSNVQPKRLMPNLHSMTKDQLRKLAGQNGITFRKSAVKSEMITKLQEAIG